MNIQIYHEAQLELKGFLYECPAFRDDLEKLIFKFMDQDFLRYGSSPLISSLFKIMINPRSQMISVEKNKQREMLKKISEFALHHPDTYRTFVSIVRAYVWNRENEKIGYCKLVRLLMGEPPNSVTTDQLGFFKHLKKVFIEKGLI